ncbi:BnaA03g55300D [Brassica napus]|uniref:BnaA03g55300D protein n=1 Tax=Brassica napus TaxID=3708 RepID=A0A078JP12_BRANA|nr:BnaA03g55300D [Brassica napus]
MKTQEGIKKYCSILSSFSTGIASSAGKFALSLPSTNSSTLPSSNPSLTVSHSTITSSSAYSTGLFPITTSSTKIPNPYTSHFSVILTVRHANFRAVQRLWSLIFGVPRRR